MKHIVFGIFFTLILSSSAWAQMGRGQSAERIKAMRVAFITNELQLTTDESQQFWPLYNEYEQKQKEVQKKFKPTKQVLQMNDTELEQQLEKNLQMEEELLALKRTYIGELKEVLPIRKIAMLQRAENRFKEELVKQLRERQENRRQKMNGKN